VQKLQLACRQVATLTLEGFKMNIHDYLIDQTGKNWSSLLAGWTDALPATFTLWLVNRFGDLFVVFDDGSVHMLDVGIGVRRRVADSRDHFARLLDIGDNANLWLMIPLVKACVSAGMVPGATQCYGYQVPPILGGAYNVNNVVTVDLNAHYTLLANLYRQTKHLPDGTPYRLL
jgi:hypothetical protein